MTKNIDDGCYTGDERLAVPMTKKEKAIARSIHAPHVDRHVKVDNDLAGWGDIIRRQGEESRAKQEALNTRHDKIIEQLEAVDKDWWSNYPLNRSIFAIVRQIYEERDEQELRRLRLSKRAIEREIVACYVIPAVFAAVRAGFVKYEDQK